MPRRLYNPLAPGPLTRSAAETVNQALRDLESLRFYAAAPLKVIEGPSGVVFSLDTATAGGPTGGPTILLPSNVCPVKNASGQVTDLIVEYRQFTFPAGTTIGSAICVLDPNDCCAGSGNGSGSGSGEGSGSGSGSGELIYTNCCPGIGLPTTICATISSANCPNLDGQSITMTWQGPMSIFGGAGWFGSQSFSCPGGSSGAFFLALYCESLTGRWQVATQCGAAPAFYGFASSYQCSPFQAFIAEAYTGAQNQNGAGIGCCVGCTGAGGGPTGNGPISIVFNPGSCSTGSGSGSGGGGGGGGGNVFPECCLTGVPQTVFLTISAATNSAMNGTYTLSYQPAGDFWLGSGCGGVTLNLQCIPSGGGYAWQIQYEAVTGNIHGIMPAQCLPTGSSIASGSSSSATSCLNNGANSFTWSLSS